MSECKDLQFSSNACLFRHEREAHGMHNHGMNPYLCEFPDCERARPDNGFPRRWNQRDHMKRVHDYEPSETSVSAGDNAPGDTKRRKGSGALASAPMKRSTSGYTKAHAAKVPYTKDRAMVTASRHPTKTSSDSSYQSQGYVRYPVSKDDVQFSQVPRYTQQSRHIPTYGYYNEVY